MLINIIYTSCKDACPLITRQMLEDGSRYYGPYTSAWAVYQTLDVLRRVFPYLTCDREITGMDKPLPIEAVQGVAISSVRELTADYKTSSEKVNRLWSNLVWSNVDNFLTIPTDCPQRDERLGWMGDAQVFLRTATCNMDVAAFFTKWCQDVEDAQQPSGAFTDVHHGLSGTACRRHAGGGRPL